MPTKRCITFSKDTDILAKRCITSIGGFSIPTESYVYFSKSSACLHQGIYRYLKYLWLHNILVSRECQVLRYEGDSLET